MKKLFNKVFKILFTMIVILIMSPVSVEAAMSSPKKGVGGEVGPDLTKLGVSWAYSWNICPSCFNNAYEHVPMIWGKNYNVNTVQTVARAHPGSYWLIWNEPNYWRQANISPTEAAQIYRTLRSLIKTADPTAKLIVGGVLWLDTGWLGNFRSEYHRLYNEWPVVEGWHVHQYFGASEYGVGKAVTSAEWRRQLEAVHSWMDNPNNGGPVELWLTEFGCLNSEPVAYQIMQDQVSWLESQPWLTRYAWYATKSDGSGCAGCTGSLFEAITPYNLTRLGQYYASIGNSTIPTSSPTPTVTPSLTPAPTVTPSSTPIPMATLTPVPTSDSCPRGELGNLDCSSNGLIDMVDLNILLNSWGVAPVPATNNHTADIFGLNGQPDGVVNMIDLVKLLNNWGIS